MTYSFCLFLVHLHQNLSLLVDKCSIVNWKIFDWIYIHFAVKTWLFRLILGRNHNQFRSLSFFHFIRIRRRKNNERTYSFIDVTLKEKIVDYSRSFANIISSFVCRCRRVTKVDVHLVEKIKQHQSVQDVYKLSLRKVSRNIDKS